MNRYDLIDCITYDKLNQRILTVGEVIMIHQNIAQDVKLSNAINDKLENVQQWIKTTKWERPDLKYNEQYDLLQYDAERGSWKVIAEQN